MPSTNRITKALPWVVAYVLLVAALVSAGDRIFQLVSVDESGIHIYDFANFLIVMRGFWFEGHTNIYSASQNMAVLTAHLGRAPDTIMPLAVTPTFILLTLPFCWLSLHSLMLAHAAWVAASLLAVGYAFRALMQSTPSMARRQRMALIVAQSLALGSYTGLGTLLIGQMSLLATAALTLLIAECWSAESGTRRLRASIYVPCLLFLSVKLPYFALGAAILAIKGHLKELMVAVATVLVTLALYSLVFGLEWVPSYLTNLGIFDRADIPPQYAIVFVFERMNIFRSAFSGLASQAVLVTIGDAVLKTTFVAVLAWSTLRVLLPSVQRSRLRQPTDEQLYAFVVGSFLLFTPYAGFYEDLLLLALWAMAARYGRLPPITSWQFAMLAACGWASFNFFLASSSSARTLMWCAKLAEVALFVMVLGGGNGAVPVTATRTARVSY